MDRIYLIVRLFSLRWKYRLVKIHIHNNQLLDIGCGTGNFLSECKRHGMEVHGVEPSSEARSKAPSTIPIVSSMDYLPKIKFGAITLWHVLEHTYDLIQMLEQIKIMLLDSGTIFIAVPNCESDDAQHYKEAWAAYDVPRHVWHFSKLTMQAALKRANLKVHAIIPMKLDAYYVSLLSEKNKSEGQLSVYGSLKAILAGLRSNLRGKRGMNYSSLLYIVQK